MTHKLLKIDGYWIVVSDAYGQPILFSQNPEHNLPTIPFSDEMAKELGVVDLEKVYKKPNLDEDSKRAEAFCDGHFYGFEDGYNQCLSDNADKKFDKNDMLRIAIHCWNIASKPVYGATYNVNEIVEKYIQYITKEEYFCELEMEEMDVNYAYDLYKDDTTKQFHFHHYDSGMITFKKEFKHLYQQPKITNNSVKIIKIWK